MADTLSGVSKKLLVNGANPAADAVITVDRDGVVVIAAADASGVVVVSPVGIADVTITVAQGGETGTDTVTVDSLPALTVTLADL